MSDLKRQHVIVIFLNTWDYLQYFLFWILGIVGIKYISAEKSVEPEKSSFLTIMLIVLAGWQVIHNILDWYFFRYSVTADGTFLLRRGIIFKKTSSVSRDRVQSIELKASAIQNIFGFTSLKVQTAGGGTSAEVHLPILPLKEAEAIRQIVSKNHSTTSAHSDALTAERPQGEESNILFKQPFQHILISGLLSMPLRGLLLFYAVFHQALPDEFIVKTAGKIYSLCSEQTLGALLIGGSAFLLLNWIISTTFQVVRYAGLTVRDDGKNIVVSYGLLSKVSQQCQRQRVQIVSRKNSAIQKYFGLGDLSIQVATAAAGAKGDLEIPIALSMPVTSFSQIVERLQIPIVYHGSIEDSGEHLPLRALPTYIFKDLVYGAFWVLFGWWIVNDELLSDPLIALPAVLLFTLSGIIRWKNVRYLISDSQVLIREGMWNLKTHIFPLKKMVTLKISQNPIQHFRSLCSLYFSNAGTSKALRISGVDVGRGRLLFNRIALPLLNSEKNCTGGHFT